MDLSGEDRAFFEQVSAAVFSNPFGPARDAIDRQLADLAEVVGVPTRQGRLDRVIARVDARLDALTGGAPLGLAQQPPGTRDLLERALLFSCFHRFADAIDAHIERQLGVGAEPCTVPFAGPLLAQLHHHGIDPPDATRQLAVFFQMRRAFFFIDRDLTGQSPCMRMLRQNLWNNIFTHDLALYDRWLWNRMEDFSSIILGETGTGKGLAAAAIGRAGFIPFDIQRGCFAESFTEAFVALNLSGFPPGLIESELFGHEKGAFTGAVDRYAGAFSRCSPHGAIFLDEIGEVEIPVQIKLLRVLQEREFAPVGSHRSQRFSGRVIAATHRDLDQRRASGHFRDDFYYRLCSDVIHMPSLRERLAEDPDELPRLITTIVGRILGDAVPAVVAGVLASFERGIAKDYRWPGNVRELEQCVRRVLITHRTIEPFGNSLDSDPIEHLRQRIGDGELGARELVRDYCRLLYTRHGTYEEVARRADLDRRTVKRYIVEP